MKLGVNVDHVATLRQSRGTLYPDPVVAAMLCEHAGCDSIVVHLREDRRHIQDRDVIMLARALRVPLNLEMSVNKNIVDRAVSVKPHQATLVPERRQELTTEGGIDLAKHYKKVAHAVSRLKTAGIQVSLFIDPVAAQIKKAKEIGADLIEINTGKYSEAHSVAAVKKELTKIRDAAILAKKLGFFVAAGHGIDYENIKAIVKIKEISELNIGHSIICRAVFIGMTAAVEEMRSLLASCKPHGTRCKSCN